MSEDKKPGALSTDDSFNYKRDSVKTLRQIGKETSDRIKKRRAKELAEKPEVKVTIEELDEKPKVEKEDVAASDESSTEEKKEVIEERKEEPKVDVEAIAKKAAEEATAKTSVEFQAKIDAILNKDKDIQEKQKEADELIASWDKEKRLPKDYQELIQETMRIADAKMEQRMRAQQAQLDQDKVKATQEETVKKAETEKKFVDYSKQMAADLDQLYSANYLPRVTNMDELNNDKSTDPAVIETHKVLKFGIELNQRLIKEGKPPVASVSQIYFYHYRPYMTVHPEKVSVQPAGADAPVSGARNTPSGDSQKAIDYKQLHNETWIQTRMRVAKDMAKRLVNK